MRGALGRDLGARQGAGKPWISGISEKLRVERGAGWEGPKRKRG